MTIDLYSTDLRSVSGTDLYRAIVEFVRADRPFDDRPREGYLLDFKQDLGERFLHSVAAFANTFGGMLILGVSEDDGRPDRLVGIAAKGELKTQVASIITSSLVPCPMFEIAECEIPNDPDGKKLGVVRIRENQEICLLARKGEKYPVYIRLEDQSPPADAFQLRSLLVRKGPNQGASSDVLRRLTELESDLFVRRFTPDSHGSRSDTYLQIVICPNSAPICASRSRHRAAYLKLDYKAKSWT